MKKFISILFIFSGLVSLQAQDYKLMQTIEGHHGGISCLVYSEEIHAMLAGDDAGFMYAYRPDSGVLLHQYKAHSQGIRSVSFNSTSKLMLSVAAGEVKIWNLEHFNLLHEIRNENYADIRFGLFSIADGFVYFNSGSRLYKTRSDFRKAIVQLYDFTESITAGVITPERSALIFSTGSVIRVLNTRTDNIIQEIQVSNSTVEQLALMPGNKLLSWNKDGTVTIWKINLGMIESTPVARFKAGFSSPMAFSSDGKRMVSGNIGNWARIWNIEKRDVVQELFGHRGNVSAFAFPGNDWLATGSADKSIKIWTKHPAEQPIVKSIADVPPVPVPVPVPVNPPVPAETSAVLFDERNIPVLVNGRTVSQTENFETNQEELQVAVYDNLVIDGDTMSLSFNGEWLLKNYGVQKQKKFLTLRLKKGNNSLILYAENLGKSPPNTAAIEFDYQGRKKIIRLRSDLKSCSALNFVYK